ncbi:MAG TPA: VOC family protein [Mycobacteriales bacterium]
MSPDPFEALRGADTAVPADPAFAADLRDRLSRALARGAPPVINTVARPVTVGALTPYLAVADARAASAWYAEVLGGTVTDLIEMPDGRVGHAEVHLPSLRIYLSDPHPEIGVVAPDPDGVPVTLHLDVDDVDAVVARMSNRGATVERATADSPYGRNATLRDPYGHRWMVMAPMPSRPRLPSNGVKEGDVSWIALVVPDAERARRFYTSVLGWEVKPGRHVGYQVVGTSPLLFLWPAGDARAAGATETAVGYRVDDIEAAVARVRAAGGTAGPIEHEDYGALCDCIDLQGRRFGLHQLDDSPILEPGARARQGDLSYLTFGVEDGERDRAFYADVLGWTYADGNPVGLLPETGMWSPGERKVLARQDEWTLSLGAVLCYQVDDIAAAVERLRGAGGECDDPRQRPYGLEVHGRDDQGIELYLHQLAP